MATITVIANNKGGVGKTFCVKNYAEWLALDQGKKVLILDLDPQTNLSRRYLQMELGAVSGEDYTPPIHPDHDDDPDWSGYSDSADIWMAAFAVPYPTRVPNLEILPGHAEKLQKIEMVREKDVYEDVIKRLNLYLQLDDIQKEYDHILLDTRPSKGPLVQAALHAADYMLIPTQMESPSVEGLYGMIWLRAQTNRNRQKGNPLKILGILPNMYQSNLKLHQEFLEYLSNDDRLGKFILPKHISNWVGYKEAMLPDSKSIFEMPSSDKHRVELSEVFEEIYSRYGQELLDGEEIRS